jgi:hypothetical protein
MLCAISPDVVGCFEREIHLRQLEAIDVAVQERVGVRRHVDTEPGRAELADHLFPEGAEIPLRLADGVITPAGVVIATYEPASTH